MGTLGDIDGHVHLQAVQGGTRDNDLGGIAKVGKLNQFLQLVVRRQRRVAQHVTHVR